MTYLANITAPSNTSAWLAINSSDGPGVIRSIMFNNGTTNFVAVRRKSNTNISVQVGTGTFNFPRMNTGDLECQSASTNTVALIVVAGAPENPA